MMGMDVRKLDNYSLGHCRYQIMYNINYTVVLVAYIRTLDNCSF